MKHIKLFLNNSKKPITIVETEGGIMMKHQIANLILQYADTVTDLTKIRVVVEDVISD